MWIRAKLIGINKCTSKNVMITLNSSCLKAMERCPTKWNVCETFSKYIYHAMCLMRDTTKKVNTQYQCCAM